MSRAVTLSPAERFFQFSLLGLVTALFLALADTGRLDLILHSLSFSLAFSGVGWLSRVWFGLRIPQRLITALATAYVLFYPIDYYFVSRDFFVATAFAGVCFPRRGSASFRRVPIAITCIRDRHFSRCWARRCSPHN